MQHSPLTRSATPLICQGNREITDQGIDNISEITGRNTYRNTQVDGTNVCLLQHCTKCILILWLRPGLHSGEEEYCQCDPHHVKK